MADLIPNCYCFGQEIGSLYWSKNAFQKDVEILHAMDPKKEKDSFEAYRTGLVNKILEMTRNYIQRICFPFSLR